MRSHTAQAKYYFLIQLEVLSRPFMLFILVFGAIYIQLVSFNIALMLLLFFENFCTKFGLVLLLETAAFLKIP